VSDGLYTGPICGGTYERKLSKGASTVQATRKEPGKNPSLPKLRAGTALYGSSDQADGGERRKVTCGLAGAKIKWSYEKKKPRGQDTEVGT